MRRWKDACGLRAANSPSMAQNKKRCFRPVVENLEDRLVPANLVWDPSPNLAFDC